MKQAEQNHPPDLSHLKRLTNFQGLIQHAKYRKPVKKYGYSIDDNARALIVIFHYIKTFHDKSVLPLGHIYFDYLRRAQLESGRFHNFAQFSGKFIDKMGGEDSFGRTIWALGYVAADDKIDKKITQGARRLLKRSIKNITNLYYLRAKAFSLLGLYYLQDKNLVRKIANEIIKKYELHRTEKWCWFEDSLTYSNAILPYSLFLAYDLTGEKRYLEVAEESIKFLDRRARIKNIPAPIGQNGWYQKGGKKGLYDQQVVDAADMVLAALTGWKVTGIENYRKVAGQWWKWFFGNNINKMPLIDKETGGCYDGLTTRGVNLNQGAESIVCYLLAYLAMAENRIKNLE